MYPILKTVLFSMLIFASLTACKKTQDENAAAARVTITEMKASTIDAANQAVAKTEQAANDIAKAADETADK